AASAAFFAAATISAGDFDATPLPLLEEEPPQPATVANASSAHMRVRSRRGTRRVTIPRITDGQSARPRLAKQPRGDSSRVGVSPIMQLRSRYQLGKPEWWSKLEPVGTPHT